AAWRGVANNKGVDSPPETPPMTDRSAPSRRGVDAVALTLCAFGAFLAVSLLSSAGAERFAEPADSGWMSALGHLRLHFFEALGLAAYVFLGGWLALALARFRRPSWLRFARLGLGWLWIIAGSAVLAHRFCPQLSGSLAGGGTIGAAGASLLERVGS